MPSPGTRPAPLAPEVRTRVGNGSVMLAGVDGRSSVARRYREIVETLRADMGGDPSEAQEQIARRAASLAIWCEQQDEGAANGKPIDVAAYTTASNSLRRLLESLGLKRVLRTVTPSLSDYAALKAAERAAAQGRAA